MPPRADSLATLTDRLLVTLQRLLPHHLLSRVVFTLTRLRLGPLKNLAIRLVVRLFSADLSEAAEPDLRVYPTFDAFFTRALRPGARPVADAEGAIVCPVDGTVSEIGVLHQDRLLQAKGIDYSVDELVAGTGGTAAGFHGGLFATLYLAPGDYHRIHMPCAGRLVETVHVPGRLFSVQPHVVRSLPRLFTRNERVAALFDTPTGQMALVLVGAICVGAIETVWAGLVTPPRGREVIRTRYPRPGEPEIRLARGEEMGRFHMGSTVIVLFGPGAVEWESELSAGTTVRMGRRLGRARSLAPTDPASASAR